MLKFDRFGLNPEIATLTNAVLLMFAFAACLPTLSAAEQASSQQTILSQPGPAAGTAVSTATAPAAQLSLPAAAPPRDLEAGWPLASHINSSLPRWLRFSGEFRSRAEGHTGYGFAPGKNDAFALTRVRLGFDLTPNPWLHGFIQVRDAEVMGADPRHVTTSMRDVFDVSQAYVEFRNGEDGWFSLKAGRQELLFGDERLIGRSNWSNASRTFDAVRFMLRSQKHGARLDLFASSVVKNYFTSFDHVQAGRNFYGANLALTKLVPKATLEPYLYVKTVPSVTGADKKGGNERLYTSGLRWSGTVPGGFDYRARYSIQSGHFANNSIRAWAWYAVLGYTVPRSRLEPRFSLEYNYASGNRSIGSRVNGTFDLLYPTTHQWRRITDLFGEQNISDFKPGFDFRPLRKLRVYVVASDLKLASRYDSLYDTSGAVLVKVPKGGALSRDIGKELDIYGTYDINQRLQLGAGLGHLFPGRFLKQTTPGAGASYPYVFLDYRF